MDGKINDIKILLNDGSRLGIEISYKVQEDPNGIAQAFLIGENFINSGPVTLILGDNLFYGYGYLDFLKGKFDNLNGAIIFLDCSAAITSPFFTSVFRLIGVSSSSFAILNVAFLELSAVQ